MSRTIQITLPKSSYLYMVKIGSNILNESLNKVLSNYAEPRLFIVTNKTIDTLYPNHIQAQIPAGIECKSLILPDGEKYKNLDCLSQIYDFLAKNNANRKSLLIAFGGGVIGDMAGFAAATFMRGMNLIQVPTTLLSQVDSGIGGKTGINHKAGKNFIGAFKQPMQTIIDVDFLDSLGEQDFLSGYAELIKHGIIQDAYLFEVLSRAKVNELKQDKASLINTIYRSCEVKARVVEADETETDSRALLNFGHTLGHFLETATDYSKFPHGHAVLVGMDFAAFVSYRKSLLDKKEFERIHQHFESLQIQLSIPEIEKEEFCTMIAHDKKANAEGVRFVALAKIGRAVILEKTSPLSLWEHFIDYLDQDSALLRIED